MYDKFTTQYFDRLACDSVFQIICYHWRSLNSEDERTSERYKNIKISFPFLTHIMSIPNSADLYTVNIMSVIFHCETVYCSWASTWQYPMIHIDLCTFLSSMPYYYILDFSDVVAYSPVHFFSQHSDKRKQKTDCKKITTPAIEIRNTKIVFVTPNTQPAETRHPLVVIYLILQ